MRPLDRLFIWFLLVALLQALAHSLPTRLTDSLRERVQPRPVKETLSLLRVMRKRNYTESRGL